jgi:hypothetical protein
MSLEQHANEVGITAVKVIPPASAGIASIAGIDLPILIQYLTVVWLLLLIVEITVRSAFKIRRWWKEKYGAG